MTPGHTDAFGRELKAGDWVAAVRSGRRQPIGLELYEVSGFTPTLVKVRDLTGYWKGNESNRSTHVLALIDKTTITLPEPRQ